MEKEFVLVSQGIEIMRTKSQENAINYVKKENDDWFDYKQRCIDNYEDYADNYIDLEIEYLNEKIVYEKIQNLKEKLNNSKEYDKIELLSELNAIGKEMYEIPLFKEYGELFRLYEETYNTQLFADTKGENKE